MTSRKSAAHTQAGSAPVEYLLVSTLVVFLVLGLIQLALTLHVRTLITDAAGEGARYGALYGSDGEAAIARTTQLISSSLPESYVQDVKSAYVTQEVNGQTLALIQIRVRAPLPLIAMLGPRMLEVSGHAVLE